MEKHGLRWDSNSRPQDQGAGALPAEPWLLMITMGTFAECDRNVVIRFTANKNVALSASTVTA